jgi:hypothetical protein
MPEIMSLSNITALKFAESPMRILKGLTFMYNANWSADGSNSLPFAFYHVTKQEEVVRNEVSQKRVILHKFGFDASPTGVMSVISDNIVPQPKVWRLSVLVPMKALLPFVDEMLSRAEAGLAFTSTYLKGKGFSNISTATDIAASGVAVIRLLTKLFDFGQAAATWATSAFGMENIADYNKISLEKMAHDRSIICMKDWSGWTYKYGVITNVSLSKEPLDEDYYKGTIEFQEMPVLLSTPIKLPNTVKTPSATQTIFRLIRPVVEGVLLK